MSHQLLINLKLYNFESFYSFLVTHIGEVILSFPTKSIPKGLGMEKGIPKGLGMEKVIPKL